MAIKFEYTGKVSDGIKWDSTSNKRITFELDDDDLTVNELLSEFMNFMKAAGYQFNVGDYLDVVNDIKDARQIKINLNEHGSADPGYGAVPPFADAGGVILPPDNAS